MRVDAPLTKLFRRTAGVAVGLALTVATACTGPAETVEWRTRVSGTDVRPDSVLIVEIRENCAEGGRTLERWARPMTDEPLEVATDRDRLGISLTVVDGQCRAYARGCAVGQRSNTVVVDLTPTDETLRCEVPSCSSPACGPAPGDAGTPPVDAGPLDERDVCDPVACPGRRCVAGACAAHASCDDLRTAVPDTPSGVYAVDPDQGGPAEAFDVWCEMGADAGWTLLMKVDGATGTFGYEDPRWTDETLVAASSLNMAETEAKLRGFAELPFTQMRVGLGRDGVTRWATLDVSAGSLRDLFAGDHRTTDLGRTGWEALLDGTALQANCNLEGINVPKEDGAGMVRIGIAANNEEDCASPDSGIGLGHRPRTSCDAEMTATTGDIRTCGDFRDEPAFGYVLVR